MPTAYLLINCDLARTREVIGQITELPGILECTELDAAYDILVKINMRTVDELKEVIKSKLKKISDIRSLVALVAIEGRTEGFDHPKSDGDNTFSRYPIP
jgi:DNA-binding Lrp family transcriptional regulator